jgi:hypothetical protein
MPTVDLAAYTPLLVVILFAAFFAVLVSMRDPIKAAPHPVSRWVWCAPHGRSVMVDFTERTQTGLVMRSVRHCPLRRRGEHCGEACAWETARRENIEAR